MLERVNRLILEKDFKEVFRKGKNKKTDFLVFKVLKNHLNQSRFGFAVSKKFFKKAVLRNRIKRKLRAAVLRKLEGLKKSCDVVIVALPGIENKKVSEIEEIIFKNLPY